MKFILAVLAIAVLNLATPVAGADIGATGVDRIGKKPVFNPIILESEKDKKQKKKKRGDGSGSEEPDCD